MRKLSTKSIKIVKTCNLYLCFLTLGFCAAIPGPCLLDLQHLVQTSSQQIAHIYTARSVGYLVGTIFGGILLDGVKSKQTVMTIFNFIICLSMIGIPWSRNLPTLAGFMSFNGLALGAVDIGGNGICLHLWGSDSGPFYQALHFCYGLGGLVAPLVAAPFLGNYTAENEFVVNGSNETYSDHIDNFTTDFSDHSNSSLDADMSNIIYPFSIIGVFSLIVTFMFLLTCIISPTENGRTVGKNSDNPNSKQGFLCTVIILNFLLLFAETCTETGYAQMLTTFVVKGRLKSTPSTGSYMTSTFWAAYTISRLASIFLAMKLSNFTLIVGDLTVTSIGSFVLLFLASYEWATWLSSVLLGAGLASFFPAAVAWLDTHINVTNKILAFFVVGVAIGQMLVPFIVSYYIDTVPDLLLYVVPTSIISCSLIVLILYLILRKREKEIVKKETEYIVLRSQPTTT